MMYDEHGQPYPELTHAEQPVIVDGLIRMATGDISLSTLVIDQLGSLPASAGLRVATYLVMLAGGAVQDPAAWAAILIEHLDGVREAMREGALAALEPTHGERH